MSLSFCGGAESALRFFPGTEELGILSRVRQHFCDNDYMYMYAYYREEGTHNRFRNQALNGTWETWNPCLLCIDHYTVDREIFPRKSILPLNFRVVLFSSSRHTGSVASFLLFDVENYFNFRRRRVPMKIF